MQLILMLWTLYINIDLFIDHSRIYVLKCNNNTYFDVLFKTYFMHIVNETGCKNNNHKIFCACNNIYNNTVQTD